jgi:hypothetical protein
MGLGSWRKRMGAEMGTEEERAWRNIWNGVRELEEEDAAWRTPEKEVSRMTECKLNHVIGYKDGGGDKTLTDQKGEGGMRIGVNFSIFNIFQNQQNNI